MGLFYISASFGFSLFAIAAIFYRFTGSVSRGYGASLLLAWMTAELTTCRFATAVDLQSERLVRIAPVRGDHTCPIRTRLHRPVCRIHRCQASPRAVSRCLLRRGVA